MSNTYRPQSETARTRSSGQMPRINRLVEKSALYPRVAVLLGVPKKWFIPLLLFRSLSESFALWWGITTAWNVWTLVENEQLKQDEKREWRSSLGVGGHDDGSCARFKFRLAAVQLLLAYLWASTAAYLLHLFAASLMSRWLLHYSPLAVLVRLCSLSILLSYLLSRIFAFSGTMSIDTERSMQENFERLSRSLLLWGFVAVSLLLGYFCTQQDISVEYGQDDERRRLVLRFKCLVALAVTSTVSLAALIMIVRVGDADVTPTLDWLWSKLR